MLETTASIQPLREWSESLIERRSFTQPDIVVPHFDPAEAGTEAEVLIVLESPGPMTNVDNVRPGSGFISVDNNDDTAANLWKLRHEAGLHHGVLLWNFVPWYLAAKKKPSAAEMAQGARELRGLLAALPNLRVIVNSGLYAQKGWTQHMERRMGGDYRVVNTWHPSALSLKQPGKRAELRSDLERAAEMIR